MEECISKSNCSPPPLSALRLLIPPIRLVSAAIWHTVQQKVVADYGMLEEFVSMVTDIVPELLTARQRVQLILGLRARLILELCQFEATADVELVQPHLDRVQMLIEAWVMEDGAANMETPHSNFVDLVKNLLENPDERELFFQKVFPVDFGPSYDDALHTLMWKFLSRLEQFLPLQTFQHVASMFGEVSSVLEECMETVSQHEELKTLLQYQKDLSLLDHNDGSLDGACIISALKLPSVERTETDESQASILDNVPSCTSDSERGSLTLSQDKPTEAQAPVDETNQTPWENGTEVLLGDVTRHEENAGRVEETPCALKQCRVQLKRLDVPLSLRSRPVRQNRGKRMKRILLEEKRSLSEEVVPAKKSASRKSTRAVIDVSDNEEPRSFNRDETAPVDNCSEDSWSYYSDEGSYRNTAGGSTAGSWSIYSGDESPFVTPISSSNEGDSLSGSIEDPSVSGVKKVSKKASSKKQGISDKASTPKTSWKVQCLMCNEPLNTSLRTHMKIHFPTGDYACPRCDSRFRLYSSFRQHLNRTCFEHRQQQVDLDKTKNLYKCDKCEEVLRCKVALDAHKLTHDELYCSVCRRVLRNAATLARHKASHIPFQCNRCEETFTLFKPLLRHCQNVHKINRPFKCNFCPKVMPKLRLLILHEWKHTGHLPFQCAQCCLRFRNDSDLSSHERVHTREKPNLCTECGKTFSHRSNLLRHLTLLHSESRNEKKHSCTECEKSFKEKGALKQHQRTKHLKELFRHPCPYCGKMLAASTIARHKLMHTGEKPFKCTVPECDKNYRSAAEVKKHVLIHHSTERPYKCDVCGKGFVTKCFLNRHAKIHSGEKPFVCHYCGKAFPKLYSMQRHKTLVHASVTH